MADPIMPILQERLADPAIDTNLREVASALLVELRTDPRQPKSVCRTVPLGSYQGLPNEIHSSWVFALRGATFYPPERHPNSIQRMFALGATGWFDTWEDGAWVTHELAPGDLGLSIPVNVWHRLTEQPDDWAVVSFHTAAESELVEIVGNPETGEISSAGTYLAGDAP